MSFCSGKFKRNARVVPEDQNRQKKVATKRNVQCLPNSAGGFGRWARMNRFCAGPNHKTNKSWRVVERRQGDTRQVHGTKDTEIGISGVVSRCLKTGWDDAARERRLSESGDVFSRGKKQKKVERRNWEFSQWKRKGENGKRKAERCSICQMI
ncbi:hypothetical protein RUM43_000555 [Polyplax serrata]|uniref:Uncharacterized protein n=1 Tax=Polyplax serrata TaxID=468196 RepID=A0AAN8XNA0_POLSC